MGGKTWNGGAEISKSRCKLGSRQDEAQSVHAQPAKEYGLRSGIIRQLTLFN